jgi:hypothetical protein
LIKPLSGLNSINENEGRERLWLPFFSALGC